MATCSNLCIHKKELENSRVRAEKMCGDLQPPTLPRATPSHYSSRFLAESVTAVVTLIPRLPPAKLRWSTFLVCTSAAEGSSRPKISTPAAMAPPAMPASTAPFTPRNLSAPQNSPASRGGGRRVVGETGGPC